MDAQTNTQTDKGKSCKQPRIAKIIVAVSRDHTFDHVVLILILSPSRGVHL